jgi:hypothetical protein
VLSYARNRRAKLIARYAWSGIDTTTRLAAQGYYRAIGAAEGGNRIKLHQTQIVTS